MTFLLASSFTDSLSRLTAEEQKAVKTTAFDLQINPANPGHSFHKLDRARDKNFWSVRVSSDIRIIVHRTEQSLMLCYTDHHDKSYQWAERRKVETHPTTGAAQIVEIRETIQEILIPKYVDTPVTRTSSLLFTKYNEKELLDWGIPQEWIADVKAADEDSILDLVDHLPSEAAEALLELATGGRPKVVAKVAVGESPFTHPDAQRRFRVLNTPEELSQALDYPWERWITFLHPDQKELVERAFLGPARVSGSAGTGKTIVALHRAVWLAKTDPDSRVLLLTFSDILANALRVKLRRLISGEPRLGERIEVHSMESLGLRLFKQYNIDYQLAERSFIQQMLGEQSQKLVGGRYSLSFLESEWDEVVDAWQLKSWEAYRDVVRLGRKTRLPEAARKNLWEIFFQLHNILAEQKKITISGMFSALADMVSERKKPPFEYVIVDEAQDISIPQLRFLSAFGASVTNRLFFCGDTGQRIFRQGFSWKSLGIDIRGRSRTLTINYRTSHQIRKIADKLLGSVVSDVDGNTEQRDSTISVFNGPNPEISICKDRDEEVTKVAVWLKTLQNQGLAPHEMCICVRSGNEIARAHEAAADSGMPYIVLDEHVETVQGKLAICTMHLAKGLEFRAVSVMACDDEIIPSQERIDEVNEPSDLAEVYNTERQLLYVACTRARDHLLVSSGGRPSEFLEDLRGK